MTVCLPAHLQEDDIAFTKVIGLLEELTRMLDVATLRLHASPSPQNLCIFRTKLMPCSEVLPSSPELLQAHLYSAYQRETLAVRRISPQCLLCYLVCLHESSSTTSDCVVD